jgi:thiosulfate/3-mercaptopyruvate sulfurtransferase
MKPGVQVDPKWVAEHLDDPAVRVVEVDVSAGAYDEGHIPGAVLWDAYRDLRHPDYTPIEPGELDAVLSRSGITPESRDRHPTSARARSPSWWSGGRSCRR